VWRLDHVVLHVGPEAMLGAEDRRERHAVRGEQPVDDVAEPAVHRGVVAEHPDARAAQAARVEQDVASESNVRCHAGKLSRLVKGV
jgi:hypothetical protein